MLTIRSWCLAFVLFGIGLVGACGPQEPVEKESTGEVSRKQEEPLLTTDRSEPARSPDDAGVADKPTAPQENNSSIEPTREPVVTDDAGQREPGIEDTGLRPDASVSEPSESPADAGESIVPEITPEISLDREESTPETLPETTMDTIPDQTNPTGPWAVSGGGVDQDSGHFTAVDRHGNIYVVGTFTKSATFGSFTVTVQSTSASSYIAKLSPAGKFLKVTALENVAISGLVVDQNDRIYISGSIFYITTLGTFRLVPHLRNSPDAIVACMDQAGKVLWVKQGQSNKGSRGGRLALSSKGFLYLVGFFQGTIMNLGSHQVKGVNDHSVFVAKLDKNGTFLWANSAYSTSKSLVGVGPIVVDAQENAYFSGQFEGGYGVTFGTFSLTGQGNRDTFIAKLDSKGNYLWAREASGPSNNVADGMALGPKGNLYLTGYMTGSSTFGSHKLQMLGTGKRIGSDIFVACLTPKGTFAWAVAAGGGIDTGRDVAIDAPGFIYITGSVLPDRGSTEATFGTIKLPLQGGAFGDMFLAKMNSSGSFLSVRSYAGVQTVPYALMAYGGYLFVTGNFSSIVTLDSHKLVSNGSSDMFLLATK